MADLPLIDETSNLQVHALRELERAGFFDLAGPYEGLVGRSVMELVATFSKQGHSGGSAEMVLELLPTLLRFKPLTPISSNPADWVKIDKEHAGNNDLWQCIRRSTTFSRDGGKTWYDIEDSALNNGDVWTYEDPNVRWVDYYLGDVPLGSVVRIKPGAYTPDPHSYNGMVGRIVGARNGYIVVKPQDRPGAEIAQHLPEKLQRLAD